MTRKKRREEARATASFAGILGIVLGRHFDQNVPMFGRTLAIDEEKKREKKGTEEWTPQN